MKNIHKKIKSVREIAEIAHSLRKARKTVVTTNGCFDVLHVGHIRNLQEARALGDVLIVGINSDRSVKINKGPRRPIVPQHERVEVIAALESVDYVFIFNAKTPLAWLKKVRPTIHAKGADRSLDQIIEREVVEKNGGIIKLMRHHRGRSTTKIIKKIQYLK